MSAWSVPVPAICNVYLSVYRTNFASRWRMYTCGTHSNTNVNMCTCTTWGKVSPLKTVTAPASPVQIKAHHHIDVYTDINKSNLYKQDLLHITVADPGGAQLPNGTQFFFTYISAKKCPCWRSSSPQWVGAPPMGNHGSAAAFQLLYLIFSNDSELQRSVHDETDTQFSKSPVEIRICMTYLLPWTKS